MLERWHARRGLDASRRPKHLLYAAEAGVFHVGFDCAARGEETAPDGTLRALHRDAQSTAWRFDDDGELVQPSIAARMAALCRGTTPSESIDVGSWELCTQPDPAGEKPKGVLNRTCALARHRAFWGDDFAPHDLASSAGAASVADAASTVAPPGHLRRFGEQGQRRVALPEVDGCVDARSFFAAHVDAHTPLLMRGCANLSNPFALRHWDDAHLLATAPEHATERDSCRAPLRDFLARYTDGGHAYRRCNDLPQPLLHELRVHPFLDLAAAGADAPALKFENVLLWMHGGTSDQMSRLHFDMNGVVLTQLDGHKDFLAVDPAESLGLYADFVPDPFVNTSPLNEQAVDLLAHPAAARVTLHVAHTRPGDVLFLPTRWWHVVRSPPAPRGRPPQRNLAFTVEISTPPPTGTLPAPPSYVHRPAFSHELLLWAWSHRGAASRAPAHAAEPAAVLPSERRMDEVAIQASGSCTAAKMGLEATPPPLGTSS